LLVSTASNIRTAHVADQPMSVNVAGEAGPRIAIAAGGTAGHVAPALAVAQALREVGAEVVFMGGDRAEASLVPAAGFVLHRLPLEGISRNNPLRALRAVGRAGAACLRARALFRAIAPHAVMGGGGYAAAPAGLAALSLGIPLVLTEADSHLGLTNRVLARGARRVCLSFPLAGREGARYILTGRPIPYLGGARTPARARFGIPDDEDCVLVFGGSLGAHSINRAASEAFSDSPCHVLHLSGAREYRELASRPRREGYDLRPYLELEEFAWALSAADLVVARSGSSVLEIAAHGVPAILVPYPHAAADHQLANASFVEAAGAAIVIPDAELDGARLAREVAGLLPDRSRMAAMARAALSLARPEAAKRVAEELLEAART
jgi:UDP-N-acetylglucosamine--N-acetylmuramyl-(pentapeptide) pyrophosphoryl-undecaprenol N-acetylglucosamine transferase